MECGLFLQAFDSMNYDARKLVTFAASAKNGGRWRRSGFLVGGLLAKTSHRKSSISISMGSMGGAKRCKERCCVGLFH